MKEVKNRRFMIGGSNGQRFVCEGESQRGGKQCSRLDYIPLDKRCTKTAQFAGAMVNKNRDGQLGVCACSEHASNILAWMTRLYGIEQDGRRYTLVCPYMWQAERGYNQKVRA